jgi:hypothetical protein
MDIIFHKNPIFTLNFRHNEKSPIPFTDSPCFYFL